MAKTIGNKIKVKSLFDHLKDLHTKTTTWENLSESDRKSFSVFMINRFLSMNPDYTDFINDFQPVTYNIDPKLTYMLYQTVLPKSSVFFTKYIKAKQSKSYEKELINLISMHTQTSTSEVIDFLDSCKDIYFLSDFIKGFGKSDKEVDKLLKSKDNEE